MEMTEDKLQSECYLWFHHTFTEYRGLLCYNLNNSRNKIQAMMDKGKGLQKGRSDMVFYLNGTGLMIEFKIETGYQSKEQKEWQAKIENAGFCYKIVRSLDQFKLVINQFIKENT